MRFFPFDTGKKALIQGCSDVESYFSKNKHIYQKLYPQKSEPELQRLAMHDWNELIPEEQIVMGGVEVERRMIEELTELSCTSLFHTESLTFLKEAERLISGLVTRMKRARFSKKRRLEAKDQLRQILRQAIDFVQPSMESLQKVELSEQEHLDELRQLMLNDRFMRKVMYGIDKKILASTTIFDVNRKIKAKDEDIGLDEMARRLVALIEGLRQLLERQNLALHEMLLELSKERPSMRAISKQNTLFKKAIPEIKKSAEFFSKLKGVNAELIKNIDEIKGGVERAGLEYIDSAVGLPDLSSDPDRTL